MGRGLFGGDGGVIMVGLGGRFEYAHVTRTHLHTQTLNPTPPTTVLRRWRETGLLGKLQGKKPIFNEPKRAKEVDGVLQAFAGAIEGPRGGALLFCVVGAKMSEGINFANEMARCVVMVGLPYPDSRDPELQQKLQYLDGIKTRAGAVFGGLWVAWGFGVVGGGGWMAGCVCAYETQPNPTHGRHGERAELLPEPLHARREPVHRPRHPPRQRLGRHRPRRPPVRGGLVVVPCFDLPLPSRAHASAVFASPSPQPTH